MSSNKYNTFENNTLTAIPPCSNTNVIFKADSGASKTYIRPKDSFILQQRQNINNGAKVQIPNGTNMSTVEQGILPLHQLLSKTAQKGNVLEGLNNTSLLSIGKLCDDNCIAVFDKRHLCICKKGVLILRGTRNWTDGLWDVQIKEKEEKN